MRMYLESNLDTFYSKRKSKPTHVQVVDKNVARNGVHLMH